MAPGSNSPAESKNSEPQTKVLKTDRDLVKYRQARDAGEPRFSRAIPDTIDVDGVQRPTRNSEGRLIHPTIEGIRNFAGGTLGGELPWSYLITEAALGSLYTAIGAVVSLIAYRAITGHR